MTDGKAVQAIALCDSYYGVEDRASTLMRIANFPDEILPLLQLETLAAFNALQCYHCDGIVELGCYDGRSLELSRSLGLRYVGVDICPQAIECLRARIAMEGLEEHAEAVLANALEMGQWADRVRVRRALIYLPFNFLGSFRSPSALLERLCRVPSALLLISVFNESEYTTRVRRRYYSACGVEALTVRDAATFTGDLHFFSRAFTTDGLDQMIDEAGADKLLEHSNRLGTCVVVKPRKAGEVRQ